MEDFNKKRHWDTIYQTKELNEVSWFQPVPETSLDFVKQLAIPKEAKIIDVGGGDGFLVDNLLGLGFRDITVLDISEVALNKARQRLGNLSGKVKWIVADTTDFKPYEKYAFWHDRAAFHFLTQEHQIENYLRIAKDNISPSGVLVVGTFSEEGPKKCSGVDIKQYSEKTMTELFRNYFEIINYKMVDHRTPFETIQKFIFGSFRKM